MVPACDRQTDRRWSLNLSQALAQLSVTNRIRTVSAQAITMDEDLSSMSAETYIKIFEIRSFLLRLIVYRLPTALCEE